MLGKILTLSNMGLKQQHKTRSNGNKQHKVGLNTDRGMTSSSKCELTLFEIQTRWVRIPQNRTDYL